MLKINKLISTGLTIFTGIYLGLSYIPINSAKNKPMPKNRIILQDSAKIINKKKTIIQRNKPKINNQYSSETLFFESELGLFRAYEKAAEDIGSCKNLECALVTYTDWTRKTYMMSWAEIFYSDNNPNPFIQLSLKNLRKLTDEGINSLIYDKKILEKYPEAMAFILIDYLLRNPEDKQVEYKEVIQDLYERLDREDLLINSIPMNLFRQFPENSTARLYLNKLFQPITSIQDFRQALFTDPDLKDYLSVQDISISVSATLDDLESLKSRDISDSKISNNMFALLDKTKYILSLYEKQSGNYFNKITEEIKSIAGQAVNNKNNIDDL